MKTTYAVFIKIPTLEWITATCDTRELAESYIENLQARLSPDFATSVGIAECIVDEPAWKPWIGTKQLPRVDPVESNEKQ